MINLAYRAYSHSYKLDPIVRTLMDTDFYKLLMAQVIWKHHCHTQVTFGLINRSSVSLSAVIEERELREQLDYVRGLRFTPNELIWLQGNTFYGQRGMFEPQFIEFLRQFQLPEYQLSTIDGEYHLEFPGNWCHTTFWEIYALSIVSELRNRHMLRRLSQFELDVMYSLAKTKLWSKLQLLRRLPDLNLTDFATRRRHSFLFQEWAVLAANDVLEHGFTGTSNTHLAMKHGLEAKGTNAHERPMVAAALANNDAELIKSQYDVMQEWAKMYDDSLLIALPDTYGTTQFLRQAPEWVADWTGMRFDSKEPHTAGEEAIAWWQKMGRDPTTKLALFTDGLDIQSIVDLHQQFYRRTRVGFGWGTLFANDFVDCCPDASSSCIPISIICKPIAANGRPTIKLSDNYAKSTGDKLEIDRYRTVFGTAGVDNVPVFV